MLLNAVLGGIVILPVYLYAREVEAEVVGGYGAASAAEVGVENAVAGAGEHAEQPLVEGDGLLRGVDARLSRTALRGGLEHLRVPVERGPCVLGHRHREAFRNGQLAPDQKAPRRGQGEVVAAPNDLVLRDTEQFVEVCLGGCHVPPYDFFPYLAAHFPPVRLTPLEPGESASETLPFTPPNFPTC